MDGTCNGYQHLSAMSRDPFGGRATTGSLLKCRATSAANPLAAQAGLEMLRAGGSAVDAAIAVQMVLGFVEPESSGIGGGAFMLVYNPMTKQTTSFDGREVAPASARPDMFLNTAGKARSKSEAIPGGLSVGIPGVVGMLLDLILARLTRLVTFPE
jgi:gamma-glutamyltranspeptidase/glutathione hydrolase